MTDSMRRGPWLSQTMFSLADATTGQVMLALGAGEARHGIPFGYERKEGLGRMKDLMQIWKLMLDCDGPFDFDGKYWKLKQTYLGTVRPKRRPKPWALGGGPKLISALFGRISMKDWVKEGYEPPFPADWHYANDYFPISATRKDMEAANAKMTREMMWKSNFVGTPVDVAAQFQGYIDVGVSWVVPVDLGGFCSLDPAESVRRMIDVARILKANPD